MTAEAGGIVATSASVAPNTAEGVKEVKKGINPELWQACAGPLVNLPAAGTHVVYFPQGHSEQVAASLRKGVDAQIPNYPNLPSKLICLLHSVTLHADPETDEVYAQMTLQPVPSVDKDALFRSDLSLRTNKPQPDFFCKTLTASDTSTHGGFSVPRRSAEKIFPPLDFSLTPPAQELMARDLHDNVWTFRHIFRGQPKRHLLTTGWSLFVSGKRLLAGDSVLFIRDEKQQLLLGIRRANRQSSNLPSSVLSSDSMHIGVLAAAAHAAANSSPFTVFFNPRASPSEFVIPLAKYYRAVQGNQISLGMRFRMMFETEESGTRRYMGTITGISDLDPVRWKNSQWRNLQVGWDESTTGEKRNRVSVWEIEPATAPFFICPPPFFRSKRSRELDIDGSDLDNVIKRTMPWLGDEFFMRDSQALPGFSLAQWMNMPQNPSLASSMQPNFLNPLPGSLLSNFAGSEFSGYQLGFSAPQIPQFNPQKVPQQVQQPDHLPKLPSPMNTLGSNMQSQQQQLNGASHSQQSSQNRVSQTLPSNQLPSQISQPQNLHQNNCLLQQRLSSQNQQPSRNFTQNLVPQQHQPQQLPQQINQNMVGLNQQNNLAQPQLPDQVHQHPQMTESQVQFQLLQKLQQQQQAILAQQAALQQPAQLALLQDQQRQLVDGSQCLPRSATSGQMLEMPQAASTSLPQTSNIPLQMMKVNGQDVRLPHQPQQTKPQNQQTSILPEFPGRVGFSSSISSKQLSVNAGSTFCGVAGVLQSTATNDLPSCSTSPSTNNCPSSVQLMGNNGPNRNIIIENDTSPSNLMRLNSSSHENVVSNIGHVRDTKQKCDVKPSLNISKGLNQGFVAPQSHMNVTLAQTDYFETSSSTTSAGLSQNDPRVQHNNNDSFTYNPHSLLMRGPVHHEVAPDLRSNILYESDVDHQAVMPINSDTILAKGLVGSGKDVSNPIASGCMLDNYENSKEAQQDLSSSMISQSFGVPDMTFNSIDSNVNDQGFMNGSAWAPPPQIPRLRTYTKVYKRGAVGRSIDITRYTGYNELKQDLARRFGIEGQLEDRGRIGWKLVYVDHENDVLLVGDDPWEEFVNCVRCIKILSPQEVQQMSLEGDIGNSVIQNQTCSSSDNGA